MGRVFYLPGKMTYYFRKLIRDRRVRNRNKEREADRDGESIRGNDREIVSSAKKAMS